MGTIIHDAVIVTTFDDNGRDLDPRSAVAEEFRALIAGPIPSVANGYTTWFMGPDGSKAGWETSDDGDDAREAFIAYMQANSRYVEVLVVTYGETWDGAPEVVER